MVRPGIRVVIGVATVVLLQLAVVVVMASLSGEPDEYMSSDQFNNPSLATADCFEGRGGLGSLRVKANITDHSNSTTVWMGILDGGWLTDCFCTRLVRLIMVIGTFKWRLRRWALPHVLILITTVNAAIASLFFSVANVAALFTACVGLIMLVVNWHFRVPLCAAMSLAYWCSALRIWWTMSSFCGCGLVVVAVGMRRSGLLFPSFEALLQNAVQRLDELNEKLAQHYSADLKDQVQQQQEVVKTLMGDPRYSQFGEFAQRDP